MTFVISAFAIFNIWALGLFALDKRRARQNGWRVSENTLLWIALLGGWPALQLGRRLFRHKTRKQPFVGQLFAATLFNIAGLVGLIWLLA